MYQTDALFPGQQTLIRLVLPQRQQHLRFHCQGCVRRPGEPWKGRPPPPQTEEGLGPQEQSHNSAIGSLAARPHQHSSLHRHTTKLVPFSLRTGTTPSIYLQNLTRILKNIQWSYTFNVVVLLRRYEATPPSLLSIIQSRHDTGDRRPIARPGSRYTPSQGPLPFYPSPGQVCLACSGRSLRASSSESSQK